MNLGLHLGFDNRTENGVLLRRSWCCEVTKVQGSLGSKLPMGTKLAYFPIKEILDHSRIIKESVGQIQDDSNVAQREAENENPCTKEDLRADYALTCFADTSSGWVIWVSRNSTNFAAEWAY